MAKEKNENWLENYTLARRRLGKYGETFHAYISYVYRKGKYEEQQIDLETKMNIQMLINVIHVGRCEISMIHEVQAINTVIDIC